jgi:hypothetical protein
MYYPSRVAEIQELVELQLAMWTLSYIERNSSSLDIIRPLHQIMCSLFDIMLPDFCTISGAWLGVVIFS